jgi:hypothetical protein
MINPMINDSSFPIELMPEFPSCPWCLNPMEKTGSGVGTTYRSTSFTCLHHPNKVWISIRYDDNLFKISLIHLYIGLKLRIKYSPTSNTITLQELHVNNLEAWLNICSLNPDPNAWPQSLNYDDLINKIDSFLPFI